MRMRGFTLIELVIVMMILGIVAVFSVRFITSSVQIYRQGADRESLMSDIRFGIERLNREVRNAVPGSLRIEDVAGNRQLVSGACVRFWPIDTARRYKDIEQFPETSKVTIPALLDKNGNHIPKLEYYANSWMIIAPQSLDSSTGHCPEEADPACAVKIITEPEVKDKDLEFLVGNISSSGTRRVFFATKQVRYCFTSQKQQLTRAEVAIAIDSRFPSIEPLGELMAEHISAGNFSTVGAGSAGETGDTKTDLYSQLNFELTASKNNEHIGFSHKIRLYNAP